METPHAIASPVRLQALRASGLLEHGQDLEFDRVTALAARLLGVSVCLVSLVEEDRQVFVGGRGLPVPYDRTRETPLSHSICQHAVIDRRPVVIRDAREDHRDSVRNAAKALGVVAYLGFPLMGPEGEIYGAFCVIDGEPRDWTDDDVGIVRDFTAIVAGLIELQAARARERGNLDLVIHDLKSPLSAVSMVSGLLIENAAELPNGLEPVVRSLSESAEHALRIVGSLAKRDQADSLTEPRSLHEILVDAARRHEPAAGEKHLRLDLGANGDLLPLKAPGWVVERVIENLLSNAIKFSPEGGTVRITARREGASGVFEIADEGPGFSSEDLPKLFRRYSRMSARPTAGESSTGLGLSIVKRLVDERGGQVELISKPGEGAVFRVSLPLAQA